MKNAVLYIHGKGGSATESEHYKSLFPDYDVMGLDYQTFTPWETGKEIYHAVTRLKEEYDRVILIANSIGAYFSINADIGAMIDRAYFISPIVDMEKLIADRMTWTNVTEDELKEQGVIRLRRFCTAGVTRSLPMKRSSHSPKSVTQALPLWKTASIGSTQRNRCSF